MSLILNFSSLTTGTQNTPSNLQTNSVTTAKAYLYLEDANGQVKGDSKVGSIQRADTIEVLSVSTDAYLPGNNPSAKKQYRPLVFTKLLDRSTAELFNDFVTSAPIVTANFRFFHALQSGQEVEYYNIEVTQGGFISSIRTFTMYDANGNPFQAEEVALGYSELQITNLETSVVAIITVGNA